MLGRWWQMKIKMHQKTTSVRKSHLRSSNLYHYAAILYTATQCASNLVGILQPFSSRGSRSLMVDVVCGHGLIWLKVIARKAQALHLIWAGRGQFSERGITRQVKDYLRCAKQHPIHYVVPRVHFVFFNAVTQPMADWLHQLGIRVHGDVVPVCSETKQKLMSVPVYFDESDGNDDDDYDLLGDGEDSVSCDSSEYNIIATVLSDDDDGDDVSSSSNPNQNIQQLEMSSCASVCSEISADNKHLLHIEKTVQTIIDESMLHLRQLLEEEEKGKDEEEEEKGKDEEEEEVGLPDNGDSRQNLSLLLLIQKCIKTQAQPVHPQQRSANSAICVDADNNGERNIDTSAIMFTADASDPGNVESGTNKKLPQQQQLTFASSSSASSYPSSYASSSSSSLAPSSLSMATIARGMNGIRSHHIRIVNLDITTLITLVSAVTHGHCNFIFPEKILTLQAKEEREKPVLPEMLDFLKGKKLCCCETAMRHFWTILDTLGGQSERQRAEELISKVKVVPDRPSQRAHSLPLTSKLKERSKIIFGTGDSLKAVTMTANSGYVRAAENQGVTFAVFIHASRALTEEKEKFAKPISEDSQQ
ncbi:UPF0415 protein C7orf25 homolog isoform X2 [Octopus bimaculoides]|uniref:UPF0415 protein C7orf25 homolog isoform X2 n=1 Tax=Octopus bimaculoides TaxID=37653 RepID=UPI0022E72312|nr:UPF0415 protein C7orf25 homolog isoform X2 [Octopus bimaculoides]